MKKTIILCLVFLLALVCKVEAKDIGILIDGKEVQFTESSGRPFADENSRTQVPLRVTMESFGAYVDWVQETQTAVVQKENIRVEVPMETNFLYVNGVQKPMDTKSVIVNQRIYLPIRFVLEEFGAFVDWNQNSQTVLIKSDLVLDSSKELTSEEISKKCSSGVFYIENFGFNGALQSTGSGFFITSDGKAVTNYHVIANTLHLQVKTTDGKIYNDVEILGGSEDLDIAILKIKGTGFHALTLNKTTNYAQGQKVYAIGNPVGLTNTMSQGIISNASRNIGSSNYIQISVPINHGSSGGALFNAQGEVIGITSAGFEELGDLNFAVPIKNIDKVKTPNDDLCWSYEYYDDASKVIDYGMFTGTKLFKENIPFTGYYVYKYDLGDYHDIKNTSITAADCFARSFVYYQIAMEELGFASEDVDDAVVPVYSGSTYKVKTMSGTELEKGDTTVWIVPDYEFMDLYVVILDLPKEIPAFGLPDLADYFGLSTTVEEWYNGSYMLCYYYGNKVSQYQMTQIFESTIPIFEMFDYSFITSNDGIYLFEGNNYSVVYNFNDDDKIWVDILPISEF